MMWLGLAFLSAVCLGFYDVFKKKSLRDNAVIPVLLLNTLFSSIIFLPFIISSNLGWIDSDSLFFTHSYGWHEHRYILLKSVIVLSSWLCGYFGMKHLPITIVGPINATRPVMVLIGALTFMGEHLNPWQWAGVTVAIISFYLMSRSGKKEGIDFKHNKWIALVVLANVFGAVSGLYDRYLMAPAPTGVGLDKMAVQAWYNIYQLFMMLLMLILLWYPNRHRTTPFRWDSCIILISLFLTTADFVYFYALSHDEAMISIVSMIRRSSVVVSFLFGAMLFHERNLRSKILDLALVLLSMLLLFIGSR